MINAKKTEIENMEIHGVYECVPDIGQKCISTRWVITEKFKDKRKIMKARFITCGYEEDSHNLKTDSPTHSHEAMHIVVLTAFLQDDKLERERFLRPPSNICSESQVWKLKRCIYGLNGAPHSWYKRVNHSLTNLKGIVSAYNYVLFLWHDATGNLMGIQAMHLDDFVFCGNYLFQKNVIAELKKYLKLECMKVERSNFCS